MYRQVLHQNSDVTNPTAKFLREGVEHLLRYLGETLTRHRSPTALAPNSRRRCLDHHHHRRRDLSGRPLPLRPRLALAAGTAPRLPSHRKSRERRLRWVFGSYQMVRLRIAAKGSVERIWAAKAFAILSGDGC